MLFRLFFALLLLPVTVIAQRADTIQRLQFGLGFGVMEHEVEFTPLRDVVALQGNSYTLNLRYFDTNLVGFQAELGYTRAGWREDLGEDISGEYERRIDFAELLILTQFSIGKGFLQPMLQAGPYLSVPLGGAETIPADFAPPASALPSPIGFDLPGRLNYGAQVGVGLNIELGPITVQADGRYLIGFSDLFRNGTTTAATSRRQGIGGKVGVFYAVPRR